MWKRLICFASNFTLNGPKSQELEACSESSASHTNYISNKVVRT